MSATTSTALAVIPPQVIDDGNYTEDDYQLTLKSDNILAVLDRVKHELSSVHTIEQAKNHLTQAELLRSFALQMDTSLEIKNLAAEHKDWAYRKMGELLRQTPDAKPGPKKNSVDDIDRTPSLKDIGISKDVSSKAQKLAAVPVEIVEAAHQSQKDAGLVVSTAGTLKRIDPEAKTITVEVETIDPEPRVFKSVKQEVIHPRNLNMLKKIWGRCNSRDRSEFVSWLRTRIEPSDGIIITGDTIKLGAGMGQLANFIWHNFPDHHDKQWDGVIKKAKAGQESLPIKGENKA